MGIDCPEEDDLPAAATSSDGIDADGVIEEEVPQEAIDATRERTPDARGDPAVAGTDFTDDASRHEYYAEFRAKVEALYLADARERWEQVKSGFQEEWR